MALMQAKYASDAGGDTIFDAALDSFDPDCFRRDYWTGRATVTRAGGGRGASYFIDGQQRQWVLRHYRRGGKAALLSRDRYLFTGLTRTRSFAEWRLLCQLTNRGLPVPRPVAARVERRGLTYRADLMTATIPGARTLGELLHEGSVDAGRVGAVGHCIARFHDAGVWHADLNAHNVLFDADGQVFLIDFDRGRLRRGTRWCTGNLQRLHRSLNKLQHQADGTDFDEGLWDALLSAYRKCLERP